MGVSAKADATVAKASAGIECTPLTAEASTLGANTSASFGFKNIGASAGAHLVEAQAGPFGIRAGVKFGVSLKYGVPNVDLGPVSC